MKIIQLKSLLILFAFSIITTKTSENISAHFCMQHFRDFTNAHRKLQEEKNRFAISVWLMGSNRDDLERTCKNLEAKLLRCAQAGNDSGKVITQSFIDAFNADKENITRLKNEISSCKVTEYLLRQRIKEFEKTK